MHLSRSIVLMAAAPVFDIHVVVFVVVRAFFISRDNSNQSFHSFVFDGDLNRVGWYGFL